MAGRQFLADHVTVDDGVYSRPFCGKLRHCGHEITAGTRYLYVCFVKVKSPRLDGPLMAKESKPWHTSSHERWSDK